VAKRIEVQIVGDASNLQRALNSATGSTGKFGSALGTLAKTGALAAGAAGLSAVFVTLRQGIKEYTESSRVAAITNATLKSTGQIANVTARDVDSLATSIMRKTGIDDEAIQAGENMLLTFTKVRNEVGKGNDIFDQATMAATNLSVSLKKDLPASAMLVGKALNDPIKGMTALTRAGIQFSDAQTKTIKKMVETGDVMGAQKVILEELTTQFGGVAEGVGKTLPAQLNILKESFSNFAGDLVSKAVPAVQRFVGFLNKRLIPAEGFTATLKVAWEGLSEVATELGAKLSTAIGSVDWTDVGKTTLTKIKTAIDEAEVPMEETANNLLEKFNAALQDDSKWEEVGQTFAQKMREAIGKGGDEAESPAKGFVDRMREDLSKVPGLGLLMRIPTDTLMASLNAAHGVYKGFVNDMFTASQALWDGVRVRFLQGVASMTGALEKIPGPFQDNFRRAKQAAEREIAEIKLDALVRKVNAQATEITPAGKKGGMAYREGFAEANIEPFITGKLKTALTTASANSLGTASSGGRSVGEAMGAGAAGGIGSQLGAMVGAMVGNVHAAIFAGSKAARAGSPSKETEEKIGVPMGQGVIVGWIKSTATLPEKMSSVLKASIEKARAAIESARDRLATVFDGVTQRILRAFDAESAGFETTHEKILREIDERRKMEDLVQRQADAQLRLNEAIKEGGDIAGAQRDLDRATEDIARVDIEAKAAEERKNLDSLREEQRIHLEKKLAALEASLAKEGATVAKATKALAKLMASFGIDFESAGRLVGEAFVAGLRNSLAAAANAAAGVNTAVPGASSFNPGPAAAGGGGTVIVNNYAPIGSEQDMQNMVVSALAKVNGRGGIS
jgi:hypothetical protein